MLIGYLLFVFREIPSVAFLTFLFFGPFSNQFADHILGTNRFSITMVRVFSPISFNGIVFSALTNLFIFN